MDEHPGPLLAGRYELGELLGRGGMADVRRARDRVLDRDVAVKTVRGGTVVDQERFVAEARVLALLEHENVVSLLDAGVGDDGPWLALELVDGETLADLLARGRPSADQLAALGTQVARGLAHAHDRGVVHRDVKPSNVLLDGDRALLTDFGVARLADATSGLTLTGATVGTAAYLAPEQVRGETVTPATDMYALGLVLLEALTGERAFTGTPVEAALARLTRGPLVPTSLPTGWPALLAALTAADPVDRPTAGAAAERLAALADPARRPAGADALVTAAVPVARREPEPRRGPVLLVVAAVLLVLALAAGTWRLLGPAEPAVAEAAPTRTPSSTPAPTTSTPPPTSAPAPTPPPTTEVAPVSTASTTPTARTPRPARAPRPTRAPRPPAQPASPPKPSGAGPARSTGPGKSKGKGPDRTKGTGKGKAKGKGAGPKGRH